MEIYRQWAGVLVCLAGLWSVNSQILSQEQLQRIAQMLADQRQGTGNGGEVPPGEVPPGEVPPGEVPPGEVPPGEVPPGEIPPGEIPSATESPGIPSDFLPGTDPLGENETHPGVPNLSGQDLQQIADMVAQILAEGQQQPALSCPPACPLACRCGHMLDIRGCTVCRCRACLRPRPRRRLCPLGFIPSRRRCSGPFSRTCGSSGVCYARRCCRRPRQSRGFSGMTSLRTPFSRTRPFRLTNRHRLGSSRFRSPLSGIRQPTSFRRFASRSVG